MGVKEEFGGSVVVGGLEEFLSRTDFPAPGQKFIAGFLPLPGGLYPFSVPTLVVSFRYGLRRFKHLTHIRAAAHGIAQGPERWKAYCLSLKMNSMEKQCPAVRACRTSSKAEMVVRVRILIKRCFLKENFTV